MNKLFSFSRLSLLLWAFSSTFTAAFAADSNKQPLNMAVYALQNKEILQPKYDLLAADLNNHLNNFHLHIHVLDKTDIEAALTEQQVDILFTNPTFYQQLRKHYALLAPIATVQTESHDKLITSIGTVMFQLSQSETITDLKQLQNQRIAVPAISTTIPYALGAYELIKNDIVLSKINWLEVDNNNDAIQAVLDGQADVGFVHTGALEALFERKLLTPKDIRIINDQGLTSYPLMLSSQLIPHWPVYALTHVSESAIKELTQALFSVKSYWKGADALDIHSFSPPVDYQALEHILTELRIPPFDHTHEVSLDDVLKQHSWLLLLLIASVSLLLASVVLLARYEQQVSKLHHKLRQANVIFDSNAEGIVITDARRRIINANKTFEIISGYQKHEILGKDPRILRSGKQPPEFYQQMWEQLHKTDFWRGEVLNPRKNGALYPELLSIHVVRNAQHKIQNYIAIFSEVSQQTVQKSKIERLLHYDALTGLPNKVLLADRIEQALSMAKSQQLYVAIATINLDDFHTINDAYGLTAGDAVLVQLSARFMQSIGAQNTIARTGGDEFIAIMGGLNNREESYALLDALLTACSQSFYVNEQKISATASIGVTFYTPKDYDDHINAEHLLAQADEAIHFAKYQGKNKICFYDSNKTSCL